MQPVPNPKDHQPESRRSAANLLPGKKDHREYRKAGPAV
jgi:hypothetical protein